MILHPGRVLLDKGVVRRIYERRLRFAIGQPPTILQVEAANAYSRVGSIATRVYITTETFNVLRQRSPILGATILSETRPLKKGNYLRRWARRLRGFSFSPEDAIVLAYGSFGTDEDAKSIGADLIVTTDKKLAALYNERRNDIEARFLDMLTNLSQPHSSVGLPEILTTEAVLALVQ